MATDELPSRCFIRHYPERGFVEYCTRDVPTIARIGKDSLITLLDARTKEVIGWRFADGSRRAKMY